MSDKTEKEPETQEVHAEIVDDNPKADPIKASVTNPGFNVTRSPMAAKAKKIRRATQPPAPLHAGPMGGPLPGGIPKSRPLTVDPARKTEKVETWALAVDFIAASVAIAFTILVATKI